MTAKKTLTPAQKKIASADRQRKTAEKKSGEKQFRDSLLNFKNVGVEVDARLYYDDNACGPGKVVFYDGINDLYLVVYPTSDNTEYGMYWTDMSELEMPKPPVSVTITVPENMVDELKGWLSDRGGKVN